MRRALEETLKATPLPKIGDVIVNHTILSVAGEGGMGIVYEVEDRLGRRFALKVLRPEKAAAPDFVRELKDEADATGSVDHEHVVTVLGQGEENGRHFILMEFVDGPPLDRLLEERGRLPWEEALEIMIQVARALHCAHGKGLIHRDVKPENVLLTKSGSARLTDFGIVKDISSLKGFLVKGRRVGTAAYASPEQCMNKRLDAATDIYSLGATFYRMVCGRPPFTGESRSKIMKQHVVGELVPPISIVDGLPKPLSNTIEKMLAKKQTDRYPSMERVVEDLTLIRSGRVAIADQQSRVDPAAVRGIKSTRQPRPPTKRPRVQPEMLLVIGLLVILAVVVLLMILR
jgi:eukaryotic-like serine/threonine-protein kinase